MKRLPRKFSLPTETAKVLREEIQSGHWGRWLPGEHELCARLHVSRPTLRQALSQLQREGWLRRADQGKRREIAGAPRRVPSATSDQVVLLTPSASKSSDSFSIFWIDALREHLAEAGYHLDVHVSSAVYGHRPARALESLVERLRPAG